MPADSEDLTSCTILVLPRAAAQPTRARAGLSIGGRIVLGTSTVSAFATLAYVVGLAITIW